MVNKTLLLMMILILTPAVVGIEECGKIVEPENIPCQVSSLWNYTPPCNGHIAKVYNQTGQNIINYTFQDLGVSNLCYYTWNITSKGSYQYLVDNGDSGNITVSFENMMIATILGIGIITGLLFWFALSLEDEHGLLKYMIFFVCISLLSIIPATLIAGDVSLVLHKNYLLFKWIFWIYVFVFFMYAVLVKLGLVVPKESEPDG